MATEDQKLIQEGVVLTTSQLIPSAVKVDNDLKTRYSAFAFISDSFLHIRIFDGTSDDLEPYFAFDGKKIIDTCFWYKKQSQNDGNTNYIFFSDSDNHLIFSDGSESEYKAISKIGGCPSLLFAAKLIFVDLIHFLITNNDAEMVE